MSADILLPVETRSPELVAAVDGVSALIVAGDTFRLAAAEHFGLDVAETHAISYLHQHGPMTQARLAGLMGITTGGVTGVVDRLERGGTARRVPDPADRRRNRIELTERTAGMLAESGDGLARALASLDPETVAVLGEVLPRLAVRVTEQAAVLRR